MITSYGAVIVASAGTPVNAGSNVPNTPQRVALQSVLFQALPNNQGPVYVQLSPDDHRSDFDTVLVLIPPPTDPSTGPFPSASFGQQVAPASLNLMNFWIDADNANDGVLISGMTG